jgi:hypothetical protein
MFLRISSSVPYWEGWSFLRFTTVEAILAVTIASVFNVRVIQCIIAASVWQRGGHVIYLRASKQPDWVIKVVNSLSENAHWDSHYQQADILKKKQLNIFGTLLDMPD